MWWSLYYNGKLNNIRFFSLIVVSVTIAFHEESWRMKRLKKLEMMVLLTFLGHFNYILSEKYV